MPVGIINLTPQTNLNGHTLTNKLYNDASNLKFGTDYLLTSSNNILSVAKGGSGNNTYIDGELLIGNSSGNTLTKSTLSAGTGISISNGNGSITLDVNQNLTIVGGVIDNTPIGNTTRNSGKFTNIFTDGNCGFGTDTPQNYGGRNLQIHSSGASGSWITFTNSTTGLGSSGNVDAGTLIGIDNDENCVIYNTENTNVIFKTAGTTKMTLDNNGDLDVLRNISFNGSLTNNGVNVETQWTTLNSNIYYNSGDVGIGLTTPRTRLDIFHSGTDSGEICNISLNSGSDNAHKYYHIANIGGGSTHGHLEIKGILAGHTQVRGNCLIDIKMSRRDGYTVLGYVYGEFQTSDPSNIVVYEDGNDYKVYLYIRRYALVNLDVRYVGSGITIYYDGTSITTISSGTEVYNLKDDDTDEGVFRSDNSGNTGIGINPNNLYKLNINGDINISNSSKYKIDGSNLSTTDVDEGSNLYYTDSRADSRITKTKIESLGIQVLGTITTGVWNGTSITSSNIDCGLTSDKIVKIANNESGSTGNYARFTSDGLKGRSVTEVKTDLAITHSDITDLQNWSGSNSIATVGTITSGTWSGNIIAENKIHSDIARKTYVDSAIQGLDIKDSVSCATTSDISTWTYDNNSGTLTAAGNAVVSIDGVELILNMRVLVKNQNPSTENGIYYVSTAGAVDATLVLTRTTDFNNSDISSGSFTFVEKGSTNENTGWVLSTDTSTITFGITLLTFTQFSGAGLITGGTNINKSGNTINLDTTLTNMTLVTTDTITMNGRINLNGENNLTDNGIYYWNTNNKGWGTYMSESGSGKAFDGGEACSYGNVTSHAIRFRANNASNKGFIWENSNSTASEAGLMALTSDNGDLTIKGKITSNGGIFLNTNLAAHPSSDGTFYRYNSQTFIGFDDNLYLRDHNYGNRFCIKGDGKVGINDDNPDKTLDVGGTINLTGILYSNDIALTGSNKILGSVIEINSTSALEDSSGLRLKSSLAGSGLDLTSQVLNINTSLTHLTSLSVQGTSATAGGIKLYEDTDNGTNYTEIRCNANISSDLLFVLPNTNGNAGEVLSTDGSGILSWALAGKWSSTNNKIYYNTDNVGIGITDPLHKLHVDGNIKATSFEGPLTGNSTTATNLSQTLAINKGGTNITTYTTGDILYSNTTNSLSKLSIGSYNQVLTVNSSGIPIWADSQGGGGGGNSSYTGGGAEIPWSSPPFVINNNPNDSNNYIQMYLGYQNLDTPYYYYLVPDDFTLKNILLIQSEESNESYSIQLIINGGTPITTQISISGSDTTKTKRVPISGGQQTITNGQKLELKIKDDTLSGSVNGEEILVIIEGCYTNVRGTIWSKTQTNQLYYNDGNVGIGDNNPINKLQVVGDTKIDGVFKVSSNIGIGLDNPTSIFEVAKSLSTNDNYEFQINFNNTYSVYFDWSIGPYLNSGNARFSIRGGANGFNNLNDFITIDGGNGNVGIGDNNPINKLQVVGDTKIDGVLKVVSNVGIGLDTPTHLLNINNNSGSATDVNCCLFLNNQTMHTNNNIGGGIGIKFGLYDNGDLNYRHSIIAGVSEATYSNKTGLAFYTNNSVTNPPTEKMRINGDGNVGIGTDNPLAKLHVNGLATLSNTGFVSLSFDGINSTSESQIIFKNNTACRFSNESNTVMIFSTNNTERMRITENGNVGINRLNPTYPLYIGTTQTNSGHNANGRYYTGSGSGAWSGAVGAVSLYTAGRVWANDHFISSSDSRIKKNIQELVDNEALIKFRQLKPSKYNYNDVISKGEDVVYGFIAQEVKHILPYAVSIAPNKEPIPNIYKLALYNNNVITFDIFHNLDSNGTIKLILYNNKEINVPYTIINTLKINIDISNLSDEEKPSNDTVNDENGNQLAHNIFVYGTEVDDFHTLNKDAIWTTATAALQEVDRIQQADGIKITNLENELQTEKIKVTTLETEVNTLKTTLEDVLLRLSNLENN